MEETFESHIININDRELSVRPFINNGIQCFDVFENGAHLFAITLNQNDTWETIAATKADEEEVQMIGYAIEKFDID